MKIKLTETVTAGGATNLKKDTKHNTISCPAEFKPKYENAVWVQGNNKAGPVRRNEIDL